MQFDQKLQSKKVLDLDLGKGREKREPWFICTSGENLYFFSTQIYAPDKQVNVFIQKINPESLSPKTKPRKVASAPYKGINKSYASDFDYVRSLDKSKILLYYQLQGTSKENAQFKLFVLDENMQVSWKKEVTAPYGKRFFDVENFKVDKHGEVHLIGKVFQGTPQEFRKGLQNYSYEILSYSKNKNSPETVSLQLKNASMRDIMLIVTETRDIICTGLYTEQGGRLTKGTYYFAIDGRTRKIKADKLIPFSEALTAELLNTQRTDDKAKERLNLYKIRDIVIYPDGSLLVLIEQWLVFRGKQTAYFADDILAMRLDKDGGLRWTSKVPKRQVSYDTDPCSYLLGQADGNIYLVFHDNIENFTGAPSEKPKVTKLNFFLPKKVALRVVKINANGETESGMLFSGQEVKGLLDQDIAIEMKGNYLLFELENNDTGRLVRISFD